MLEGVCSTVLKENKQQQKQINRKSADLIFKAMSL